MPSWQLGSASGYYSDSMKRAARGRLMLDQTTRLVEVSPRLVNAHVTARSLSNIFFSKFALLDFLFLGFVESLFIRSRGNNCAEYSFLLPFIENVPGTYGQQKKSDPSVAGKSRAERSLQGRCCQDLGRSNRWYPIEALGVSYVPVDLRRLASRARIPIS